MNYRHIYHAGSFVDVIKHSVLTILMDYLNKKEAPYCYIDTHAGEGLYDLNSEKAQKTIEAQQGIQRILQFPGNHPQCLENYVNIVKQFQTTSELQMYPGSPMFADKMKRQQDSMILNELLDETYYILKKNFFAKSQVMIHRRSAYELLPSLLPPKERRGLVLIDPPFESKNEHEDMKEVLKKCLKRWPNGIYLIWYPITAKLSLNPEEILLENSVEKYVLAELTVESVSTHIKGLVGTELLIINPIWQLAEILSELFPHLWSIFSREGQGRWSVRSNSRSSSGNSFLF